MLTTLRSVFDLALRKGVVQFNPALDVDADGSSRPRNATP